jgi:uncharacterized protein (DUF2461 family)
MESPGFYVHLEPPIFLLGAGYYMFPDSLLERFRRAVVHPERGKELASILKKIAETTDFKLGGQHYKRIPAGYDASHPNSSLLMHNGLHVGWETSLPKELFDRRLVDRCFEKFSLLGPLHRWLVGLMISPAAGSRQARS